MHPRENNSIENQEAGALQIIQDGQNEEYDYEQNYQGNDSEYEEYDDDDEDQEKKD